MAGMKGYCWYGIVMVGMEYNGLHLVKLLVKCLMV